MADVRIGGFDASAVKLDQRCFPEEVEPKQLPLGDQLGVDVDGLLEGDLKHDLSIGTLGR